jgi:hypothetical protein
VVWIRVFRVIRGPILVLGVLCGEVLFDVACFPEMGGKNNKDVIFETMTGCRSMLRIG